MTAALWALAGQVIGLGLSMTMPRVFGLQTLGVVSDSMEPTLHVGSLVVNESISPIEARVGDIVTSSDPRRRKRLLTQRVKSITIRGSSAFVVTKGDANDAVERWSVPVKGKLGRVAYNIPYIGYPQIWAGQASAQIAILVVLACLGLWLLIDIWRLRPRRGSS